MKNQQAGKAQAPVRAPIAISRGVIAAVFMIIIIVAVVAVVLVARGGGAPGGLPVYSGASEFNRTEVGTLTSAYYDLGTADLATVYNWYKTEMPKEGWTLTGDNPSPDYNSYTIDYTKGSDSVEIVIVAGTIQGYSANKVLVLAYTCGGTSGTSQPC